MYYRFDYSANQEFEVVSKSVLKLEELQKINKLKLGIEKDIKNGLQQGLAPFGKNRKSQLKILH